MTELAAGGDRRMTVKEVARQLGCNPETVKRHIRKLFPELMENGKTTLLDEKQVTIILEKMKLESGIGAGVNLQNQIAGIEIRKYTLKELSGQWGVNVETIRINAKVLFPECFENGKTTYLNPEQSTILLDRLKQNQTGSTSKAGLEVKMNEVTIFENPQFGKVRTYEINGEPCFIAKDVCDILGVSNPSQAISTLENDEKGLIITETLGGRQEMSVVYESGLYALIFKSKKPEAKIFRKWVTSEVLPAIRKHGLYAADDLLADPDLFIKALTALKEERARRSALQRETARLQIKADEHETYLTVKRVAKLNGVPWHSLDWKRVKRSSHALELEWRKADDLNYGACNAYHVDAWRDAYPSLKYAQAAEVGNVL